jgi:hypothetical protein
MLMRGNSSLSPDEKKALKLLRALGEEQRQTVVAFMEFLSVREEKSATSELAQPVAIARPAQESVIKAIKRLRATYPMLDQNKLFGATSQQMTEHLMHGKPAGKVIDELEELFAQSYQLYLGNTPQE